MLKATWSLLVFVYSTASINEFTGDKTVRKDGCNTIDAWINWQSTIAVHSIIIRVNDVNIIYWNTNKSIYELKLICKSWAQLNGYEYLMSPHLDVPIQAIWQQP